MTSITRPRLSRVRWPAPVHVAPLLIAAANPSCGNDAHPCTLADCASPMDVTLDIIFGSDAAAHASSTSPITLRVETDAELAVFTCETTCSGGAMGDGSVLFSPIYVVTTDTSKPGAPSIRLQIPINYGHIAIQVSRDGMELASEEFTAAFNGIYYPNGPGCPPRCENGPSYPSTWII